ncbi:MAG: hypothetical protein ACKOXB_01865 [Flavobacteriales bacterium]
MKAEEIKQLFIQYESVASEVGDIEYWSAWELQVLPGYTKWKNFEKVIQKAKESCDKAGESINAEQHLLEYVRVKALEKLSQPEKYLSGILYERVIDHHGFSIIRSKSDKAVFKLSTPQLKKKLGIPANKPIADFIPTISTKAKNLTAKITSVNVQSKDMRGQNSIV